MAAVFIALLTAHLLGDFILQPSWMAERRRQVWILLLHAALVTLASYLLLGTFHWEILSVVLLAHFGLDVIRAYLLPSLSGPF